MKRILRHLALSAGLLCPFLALAQELITPVSATSQEPTRLKSAASKEEALLSESLSLPFIDDFSLPGPDPDPARWADSDALVNQRYGVSPLSVGVLTLDAIDAAGSLHVDASGSRSLFEADELSSLPLNMLYPASDSIYLSFLYQPAGLGDRPEERDSLIVDFYDPASESWSTVWSIAGDTLQPFRQAMLPVTQDKYLQDGFRFRFRNLCSLPTNNDYPDMYGNVDHWQLDYVRLDRARSHQDTVLPDVAFTEAMGSLLNDLRAVPWQHFPAAYNQEFNSPMQSSYRNNDEVARNVTRSFHVLDYPGGDEIIAATSTAMDIAPFTESTVEFPYYLPVETGTGDSGSFLLEAALRSDDIDLIKSNDTIRSIQTFTDFYAYDDGLPEAGYGLRGQGTANGSVAMKYESFGQSRLGGVEMLFNQLYDSLNLDYYFKLMVWGDNEDLPGIVLHEDEEDITPEYTDSYPGFRRYHFSSPVDVNGTFYVGWTQYNEYMLNIGLDRNTRPAPHVVYYNHSGNWIESGAPGVLMIRPFLYDEHDTGAAGPETPDGLRLYPNPASGPVHIALPGSEATADCWLELYDMQGRCLLRRQLDHASFDVSGFPDGLYSVRLIIHEQSFFSKLLIGH